MSTNTADHNNLINPNEGSNPTDENIKDQIMKTWGSYCSACGAMKDKSSLKLIGRNGPAFQYVSECHNCGLKTVLTFVPNLGMQVSQLRTDVSVQEMRLFNKPLTSYDFLEFYARMKKVNTINDLSNLFQN